MFDTDVPLERLPGESARAHEAIVEYAALGPERSLAKLAHVWGKSRSYVGQLERWSARYRWQERVAAYDEQVARTRVQRAATQYIADVEAHRESSRKTSQELRAVARACLAQLAQAANEGTLVLTVSHLNAIVRTFETSIEMDAHALCLDRLLPMLDVANEQGHPFDSADYEGAAR
jgi:hypothetical protein